MDSHELLKDLDAGRKEAKKHRDSSSDEDPFVSFKEFKQGGKLRMSEQYEIIKS